MSRLKRFTDDVALLLLDRVLDVLDAVLGSERARHALLGELHEVGFTIEVAVDDGGLRLDAVPLHLVQNEFALRRIDVAEDEQDVHGYFPSRRCRRYKVHRHTIRRSMTTGIIS